MGVFKSYYFILVGFLNDWFKNITNRSLQVSKEKQNYKVLHCITVLYYYELLLCNDYVDKYNNIILAWTNHGDDDNGV